MWRSVHESVDPSIGPFFEELASEWRKGGRKSAQRVLARAPQRARTTGPVRLRDGVDYSIRYARVGGNVSFQVTYKRLTQLTCRKMSIPVRIPNFELCMHNCIETVYMTDEACRLWTIWAEENDVQFNGHYSYIFPGRRTRGKYRKAAFDAAKEAGEVPSCTRSRASRLARAERRKSKKPVLRKGWTPLSIKEPLVVRPSRSAASIRNAWWRLPREAQCSWSTYRSTVTVEPVLSLWCGRARPVPKLVADSIRRIYSPERVILVRDKVTDYSSQREERKPPVIWPKANHKPEFVQEPPMSMEECLRRHLSSIEERGFKETYTWFKTNQLLLDLQRKTP